MATLFPEKGFRAGGATPAANSAVLDRDLESILRESALDAEPWSMERPSSLRSSLENGPRASESCVTRQTSGEDCARQRFIVWAAIKRNKSTRISRNERLTCPLLRCGKQFGDHEAMLRHLTECRHFATGQYVCYECMRVECFNDSKCRCCLGHPTKRRRIMNLAKNFFSTLGHKSRKEEATRQLPDETTNPPPSYDSLGMLAGTQLEIPDVEMGGTEILEMDATAPEPVQLDEVNYETPAPRGACPPGADDRSRATALFPTADDFSHLPSLPMGPVPSSFNAPMPAGNKPSLALDTRNIGQRQKQQQRSTLLAPSSSIRSVNSSISPMSAGSAAWTMGSSIETTFTSPITPFSPADYETGALSRENSCKFPKDYHIGGPSGMGWNSDQGTADPLRGTLESAANNDYMLQEISELPGDDPQNLSVPRILADDPFFFDVGFNAKEDLSWPSTFEPEINVVFARGETSNPSQKPDEQEATATPDAQSLVDSVLSVIHEHVLSSSSKLASAFIYNDNPLAADFSSLPARQVAFRGLALLKSFLNGMAPRDPLDHLCFVHVIYALSLVLHDGDLTDRCNQLFNQALAYQGFVKADQCVVYSQVVRAIWQPSGTSQAGTGDGLLLSQSTKQKGKQPAFRLNPEMSADIDPLVTIAKDFLDELEIITVAAHQSGLVKGMPSDLWMSHVDDMNPNTPRATDAFTITVGYVIDMLSRSFGSDHPGLITELRKVKQRVNAGELKTVRRVELGLIEAGKTSLHTNQSFDEFVPQVRGLCDPLYSQQGFNPREKYHNLGVELIECLAKEPDEEAVGGDLTTQFAERDDVFIDFLHPWVISSPHSSELVGEPLAKPPSTVVTTAVDPTVDPMSLNHRDASPEASVSTAPGTQFSSTEPTSTPTNPAHEATDRPAEESTSTSPVPKVEAQSCCEICGYRPKGHPQWFKGSMAKHKKLQHSTNPPQIYKCPYPGCNSAYKNRPDNLRQHQIEKMHFVDGGDIKGRRQNKRKKPSD